MRNFFALGVLIFLASTNLLAQQQRIDSLLRVLPSLNDERQRVDVLNDLAFQYTSVSFNETHKFLDEALHIARDIRYDKGLAESLKILGLNHFIRSEYTLAAQYSYQSLNLYEKLEDKAGQAKVLNNLSMVLSAQKDVEQAYKLTLRSLSLKREEGDSLGVANSLLLVADYYSAKQDFRKAETMCRQALKLYETLRNDWGISHVYLSLGNVYHAQQNFPMAIRFYKDGVQYARLSDDNMQVTALSERLARLFMDKQMFDSAYHYLHGTLAYARAKNSRSHLLNSMQLLTIYFEKTGRLDSALYYMRQASTIEHEIADLQKTEQLATVQSLYEFEKKEQDLGFQKKIVRRQYIAIGGVSLILVLSILLGYKFYGLNKTNQQAKETFMRLNSEINRMNESLEIKVQERTEEIAQQNQRLIEYAFFTAHEIRGPLARILGLVELAKIKELTHDREEIIKRLEEAANELDDVIRTINRKLEGGRRYR
jgi:tetratricopeptide (TPR) repeat protein